MFDAWKRFEHLRLKPFLQGLRPYSQRRYGRLRVHYTKNLDGGGNSFVEEFIPLMRGWGMRKQGRVFEWCAGPGFIGFGMLARGLCETLCLADINQAAVRACERTIRANGLGDRVTIHHSNNLRSIPKSERWDLVVSNPPHFADAWSRGHLITYDGKWRLHREFFRKIDRFLAPGGVVVLQENNRGSTPATFRKMIEAAGLRIVFAYNSVPKRTRLNRLYYLGIARRGDVLPSWVAKAARA